MSELQRARIAGLCGELRLGAVPDLYGATAQAAATRDASLSDFPEDKLRAEREVRRSRARDMLARMAGFPAIKTLDGYDFGFATGAPRQQIRNWPAWPSWCAPRMWCCCGRLKEVLHRTVSAYRLLIIDEIGYLPMARQQAGGWSCR